METRLQISLTRVETSHRSPQAGLHTNAGGSVAIMDHSTLPVMLPLESLTVSCSSERGLVHEVSPGKDREK